MASRLFFTPALFSLRTPLFAAGLGVSAALFAHSQYRSTHLHRLDSSPLGYVSPKDWSFSQYQHDAKVPLVQSDGKLNARAVRQISTGSILGSSTSSPSSSG